MNRISALPRFSFGWVFSSLLVLLFSRSYLDKALISSFSAVMAVRRDVCGNMGCDAIVELAANPFDYMCM